MDAIIETVLLSWVLVWSLVALGFPEPDLDPLEPSAAPVEAAIIAGVIAVIL